MFGRGRQAKDAGRRVRGEEWLSWATEGACNESRAKNTALEESRNPDYQCDLYLAILRHPNELTVVASNLGLALVGSLSSLTQGTDEEADTADIAVKGLCGVRRWSSALVRIMICWALDLLDADRKFLENL